MTRPKTGTCQSCEREHPLDDGRHLAAHPHYFGHACCGSGKLSTEAQAANAATAQRRASARFETLRADAAVAHDAVLSGYPFPAHQVIALCKAALQEYRIKFPAARVQRPWFFARKTSRGSRFSPARSDVFCSLCREILLPRAARGLDHTERTREHTVLCALKRLSGMAPYVTPDERRLPADVTP